MRRRRYRKQPLQKKESGDQFLKPTVQTKLNMGQPGDRYEVEADRMADQVVNNKTGDGAIQKKDTSTGSAQEEEVQQKPLASSITPLVQKMAASEEEGAQAKLQRKEEEEPAQAKEEEEVQKKGEEEEVQAKEEEEVQKKGEEEEVQAKDEEEVQKKGEEEEVQAKEEEEVQKKGEEEEAQAKEEEEAQAKSNGQQQNTAGVEQKLRHGSGGQKMDADTQVEMEQGFGVDFNNVRIHNDSEAQQMSQELGAQAFTHGNDIYFSNGKYNPNSKDGKHLLAHELTHTIQQNGAIAKKETPDAQKQGKASGTPQGTGKKTAVQVNIDMTLPSIPKPDYSYSTSQLKALESADMTVKAKHNKVCKSLQQNGVAKSYVESVDYDISGSTFEYYISSDVKRSANEAKMNQNHADWILLHSRIKRHARHHFVIYKKVAQKIKKEMIKDFSRLPSKSAPSPIALQLLNNYVATLIQYWDARLKHELWKETCAWEKKDYPRILKGLSFHGILKPSCGKAPKLYPIPMIPQQLKGSTGGASKTQKPKSQ